MLQFSGLILDRLIAPDYSSITTCGAPEFTDTSNYSEAYFLNNIIMSDASDKAKSATIAFLRRLDNASREYRQGRQFLLEFVQLSHGASSGITSYLRSLSHFEHAMVNAYLALLAHNEIARTYVPQTEKAYSQGDGSALERLGLLYNTIKHSLKPDLAAPVWLTNEGLRGIYERKGGAESIVSLAFTELIDILQGFNEDARFLSEDVYRVAAERRAAREANTPIS